MQYWGQHRTTSRAGGPRTDPAGVRVAVPGSHIGSRAEYAARILERLAEEAEPGERLGTKVDLRARCDVSVGTFNEAVKLAQSRGCIVSRLSAQ